MAAAKTKDGLTLNKDGSIVLVARGTRHVLDAASMGQYRRIKRMSLEALEEVSNLSGLTEEQLQSGAGADSIKNHELMDSWREKIVLAIFSQATPPLSEDVDTWPVWLASNDTIANKVMTHWRTVPL